MRNLAIRRLAEIARMGVVLKIDALDTSHFFSVCSAGELSGQSDDFGKSWVPASLGEKGVLVFFLFC